VPFQNFTITQITNNGKADLAAISPDGRYILHVQNDNGLPRPGGPHNSGCPIQSRILRLSGVRMQAGWHGSPPPAIDPLT
jgi:hypothetical protein